LFEQFYPSLQEFNVLKFYIIKVLLGRGGIWDERLSMAEPTTTRACSCN
jgi:hypothetical protein